MNRFGYNRYPALNTIAALCASQVPDPLKLATTQHIYLVTIVLLYRFGFGHPVTHKSGYLVKVVLLVHTNCVHCIMQRMKSVQEYKYIRECFGEPHNEP
jgi:hypothetical protein